MLEAVPANRLRGCRRLLVIVAWAAAFMPGRTLAQGTHATSGDTTHVLFTEVLGSYVERGSVDYRRLCGDPRFSSYLATLSATDPSSISDSDARLAFWINAYNAFTIRLICDNYPVVSIKDIRVTSADTVTTAWDGRLIRIGGSDYSLNEIEHDIIRPLGDFRVHFALVCAAKSCPPLRSEAYEGRRLNEQLDDQGRIFLGQTSKNYFDLESRVTYLSRIMAWYAADFGDSDENVLLAIAPFLAPDIASDIRANAEAWGIEYTAYDWSLNN